MTRPWYISDAVERAARGRLRFGDPADIETRELIWLRNLALRKFKPVLVDRLTGLHVMKLIEQLVTEGELDDVRHDLCKHKYFCADDWDRGKCLGELLAKVRAGNVD